MPRYRLQPTVDRTWWWSLFGATAVILLLPVVFNLLVPDRERREQAYLGMPGYSWEIPLDMTCEPMGLDSVGPGWRCDGVMVQSLIADGGEDPERTLRRMMRAMNFIGPADSEPVFREGQARMLIDTATSSVGLSLEGEGDRASQTMVAVITGPGVRVAPVADQVWGAYTGGKPLPAVVTDAIVEPSPRLPVPPLTDRGRVNV